jgi:ATP-binding cassette, subfamily B, bacterial
MAILLLDDDAPQARSVHELPGLLRRGVAMVWAAARGELLVQVALQALGGVTSLGVVLLGAGALRHLVALAGGAEHLRDALPALLALAAVVGLGTLAGAVGAERQLLISELVQRAQRARMLRITGDVELLAFQRPAFHDALARAQRSGMNGPVQLVLGLGELGMSAASLLGALVALAALEPLLVPLALVCVVPAALVSARAAEDAYRFAYRLTARDREREYLASVLASREPAAEVRAYGLAGFLRERWWRLATHRVVELRRLVRRQHLLSAAGAAVGALAVGAVLVALFALVGSGDIDGAAATAAGGALLLLGQRLLSAASGAGRLYEALLYVGDVARFEALDPRAAPSPALPAPARSAPVAAREVTFAYPSASRPALRGVSVSIAPGEVVALVGENGSGKTTLAMLLAGLYRPDAGTVTWDGVDVAGCDPAALRARVAIVLQEHMRWLLPAHDNIALGRHERFGDEDGVRRAADAAGIAEAIARLPAGWATVLGPEFAGGSELSGGQWQRVAVARALFRDAGFVVLDEPTAALDARAEHDLFASLRTLLEGRSGLIVSHRFSTVRDADRIYVLHEGEVTEAGDHDALMALGGRYAELFTLQAESYR